MKTMIRSPRRASQGFSLIEVLVAAVVLATGLLALAALQASLSRNAADARARSQIASFVDLAIERVRSQASGSGFADVPPTTAAWSEPWDADELSEVAASAGVSNLDIEVDGVQYRYNPGTDAFVEHDPAVGGNLAPDAAQYKEVTVTASWTDATGADRSFSLATIVSPRTTTDSNIPFTAPTGTTSGSAKPIVRTASPVEPGVIPIAIGDNSDTAATNPKPVISAGNVIRTSYEVLTYRNEGDGSVRQQRRVETAVVGCRCEAGTPTGAQFETAQWPAYWNGERYVIYTPEADANPPGAAANTTAADGENQDVLCTECCRDHHDAPGDTHVKFDPFRTDNHVHYDLQGGNLIEAAAGEEYVEACRMIRVDGFWRTAQDLDAKHFGLLETDSFATSPVPAVAAQNSYEEFAIDFLTSNYVPGQTAVAAETVFNGKNLNLPLEIGINRPNPPDERYLHARGLYVDYIEDELAEKIQDAHSACQLANPEECVLPLLAFTTINLTEPAFWSPSSSSLITVDSDGFVVFRPDAPNRGRVNAIATASPSTLPEALTRIQKSNSGVAVRDRGVDPEDDVDLTDSQTFRILGGLGSGESGLFNVSLTGLPTVQRSPGVSWQINSSGNNCQGPSPYKCTTSVTLPASGSPGVSASVLVASYNQFEERKENVTVTCPNSSADPNTPSTHTYSPNGQKRVTFCRNYAVSSVSGGGTIAEVLREGKVGDPSSGSGSEATRLTLPVNEGSSFTVGFSFQEETVAPVLTCTFKNNGSLDGVTFGNCP